VLLQALQLAAQLLQLQGQHHGTALQTAALHSIFVHQPLQQQPVLLQHVCEQ
jgi:hypothetical protein